MEFVSPKFTSVPEALRQLGIILAALFSHGSTFTVSRSCGLHVYVGRANDSALNLDALQALAFATLMFEQEIDRLHPHSRIYNGYCMSNSLKFTGPPRDNWDPRTRHLQVLF